LATEELISSWQYVATEELISLYCHARRTRDGKVVLASPGRDELGGEKLGREHGRKRPCATSRAAALMERAGDVGWGSLAANCASVYYVDRRQGDRRVCSDEMNSRLAINEK
jgi:hypothetical protein